VPAELHWHCKSRCPWRAAVGSPDSEAKPATPRPGRTRASGCRSRARLRRQGLGPAQGLRVSCHAGSASESSLPVSPTADSDSTPSRKPESGSLRQAATQAGSASAIAAPAQAQAALSLSLLAVPLRLALSLSDSNSDSDSDSAGDSAAVAVQNCHWQ